MHSADSYSTGELAFGMEPVSINDPRPLLIYDGDCGFCNYWVRYWQKLTGDRVAYAPYQETAAQYPEDDK